MTSSDLQDAVPYLSVAWVIVGNIILYVANENSILRLFISCRRRLLRITNRIHEDRRPERFLCWDILDPDHIVTGIVPLRYLLAYRAFALASFGFTIMFQGLWGSGFSRPPFSWLTFFTNWTYTGYGLYWVLSLVILLRKLQHYPDAAITQWTVLHQVSLLVFEIICPAAVFLTFFYWGVVYQGGAVALDNVMRHGVNVVILLGDLFMSRFPIVSYHLQVCFAYVSIYAGFMWVYYGVSNDWVYTALDWNDGIALIYYIAIPFLVGFCFFITYAIAWLREALVVRRQTAKYSQLEQAQVEMATVV